MTVRELIDALQDFQPGTLVSLYAEDIGEHVPIDHLEWVNDILMCTDPIIHTSGLGLH